MNAIPLDTTIKVAKKQYEILQTLTPEKRLSMAFELSDYLRSIVQAGVKQRHPDYNEQQTQKEVLRLMVGITVLRNICPDNWV